MAEYQAITGMKDIVPEQSFAWQKLESLIRQVVNQYGFHELRTPCVEKTALFKRSIGEVTDIVEKEMYTFTDLNGESLTLRPEGTASAIRAGIEQGLLYNQIQRIWYMGPMFRHERPQKGRYRQFHQAGIEVFGLPGPDIDAELIALTNRLWRLMGISDSVTLQINTLGCADSRTRYKKVLQKYLTEHKSSLDEDSQRRLHTNPLRILDSKSLDTQQVVNGAPKLIDFLSEKSLELYQGFKQRLDRLNIAYIENPKLVRGLDYYNDTVFEWVTDELGAQGTVCAGGRFDKLVSYLGGHDTPAVGCALGLERLILLNKQVSKARQPDIYIVIDESVNNYAITQAEQLRDALPNLMMVNHCGGGKFKQQLKKANKSGAIFALIIGETEASQSTLSIKHLTSGEQSSHSKEHAVDYLSNYFKDHEDVS